MAPAGMPQSRPRLRQLPAQSLRAGSEVERRLSVTAGLATARWSRACRAGFLDRRAWHIAEGAEHAAVSVERPQQRAAVAAVIEVLAGVGRHSFRAETAAFRARDRALKLRHRFSKGPAGLRRSRLRRSHSSGTKVERKGSPAHNASGRARRSRRSRPVPKPRTP